jgi:hypothetical protein
MKMMVVNSENFLGGKVALIDKCKGMLIGGVNGVSLCVRSYALYVPVYLYAEILWRKCQGDRWIRLWEKTVRLSLKLKDCFELIIHTIKGKYCIHSNRYNENYMCLHDADSGNYRIHINRYNESHMCLYDADSGNYRIRSNWYNENHMRLYDADSGKYRVHVDRYNENHVCLCGADSSKYRVHINRYGEDHLYLHDADLSKDRIRSNWYRQSVYLTSPQKQIEGKTVDGSFEDTPAGGNAHAYGKISTGIDNNDLALRGGYRIKSGMTGDMHTALPLPSPPVLLPISSMTGILHTALTRRAADNTANYATSPGKQHLGMHILQPCYLLVQHSHTFGTLLFFWKNSISVSLKNQVFNYLFIIKLFAYVQMY